MDTPEISQTRRSLKFAILQTLILALLTGGIFFFATRLWLNYSIENVKTQQRNHLSQYVVLARNMIDPLIQQVRSGQLSQADALTQVRDTVRRLTYTDEYGPNYIFMSSYDGLMLVQPYEPQKELSNMWDLQDIHGVYIIRGLVNTAQNVPQGGFFTYYHTPPNSSTAEEKLSFVIGIPELKAYIGTGTYMGKFYAQQENIFNQVRWLLLIFLILIGGTALLNINRLTRNNHQLVEEIEKRRRAQEVTERSEKNLQMVFDSMYDAVFIHDYQGNILKVNQRMLQMYEVDENWVLKSNVMDTSAPQTMQKNNIETIWDQVRQGHERVFEWKCLRPFSNVTFDGEVGLRPVDWYGQAAVLGVVRNINERKQVERALRESENRYRAFFEGGPDGVVVLNPDTAQIIQFNDQACRQLGYTREEFARLKVTDIEAMEAPEETQQRIQNALTRGRADFETLQRTRQGEIRNVQVMVRIIDAGQHSIYHCIWRDVTERKRAENALLQSKEALDRQNTLFNALLKNLRVGVFMVEAPTGKPLIANEAALRLLGRGILPDANKENIGEVYEAYRLSNRLRYPPDEMPILLGMEGISAHIDDMLVVRPDQSEVLLEVMGSPIIDHTGKVWASLVSFQDITERKQNEQKILELNTRLEQRVRERTSQLEAANREMQSFSYSVSHDLRSPLRTIDGFSQMLQSDFAAQLDPEAVSYLGRIREATQRMAQLIEDLLNLSRIVRSEISCQEVNLSQVAAEIAASLQEQNGSRQVEWEIQEGMVAQCDAHLIRIALTNLLENAYKFTGQKETAQIKVGMEEQNGETVYFVSDNGSGLDMAYADKLFMPFQRLHSTREFPGTGIGLSIVQRIVTRHGGRIWPQSEVGQGATFYFTLGCPTPDKLD